MAARKERHVAFDVRASRIELLGVPILSLSSKASMLACYDSRLCRSLVRSCRPESAQTGRASASKSPKLVGWVFLYGAVIRLAGGLVSTTRGCSYAPAGSKGPQPRPVLRAGRKGRPESRTSRM